jgi:DNA-directed RNA polymerase subunit RPC12/RpoP
VTTPSPGVKILVAGVDKDSKASVEAAVRKGLGPQVASGPWSISVVSLAGKWSVTLDGPGERLRGLSFAADTDRLAEAIRDAVSDPESAPPGAAPPQAVAAHPAEVRESHLCGQCGKGWLVVYESRPDEPRELAPVACPHCWKIGHVEVGAWAAAGGDYRSERA